MNKLLLSLALTGVTMSGFAQQRMQDAQKNVLPCEKANKKYMFVDLNKTNTQSKTNAGGSRWFNHTEAVAQTAGLDTAEIYASPLIHLQPIWKDSFVIQSGTNHVFIHSVATTFVPTSPTFAKDIAYTGNTIQQNVGKIKVTRNDAYNIDSIYLRGAYVRNANSTVIDTMVFSITTDTIGAPFQYLTYNSADLVAAHNTDDFYAMLVDSNIRYKAPIVLKAANVKHRVFVYKMLLTSAIANDTFEDGTQFIKFGFPTPLAMPAGTNAQIAASFVSGDPAAPRVNSDTTLYTRFNYFLYMGHETDNGQYVKYDSLDRNNSCIFTTRSQLFQGNYIFTPTIAYTAPWPLELNNFSIHVNCATCNTVSVADEKKVEVSALATPNPAANIVTIPVTVSQSANVVVTLANVSGQIVATNDLGKVVMGTTSTNFNVSALPNGIYTYQVKAGDRTASGKVVVAH